VQLGVGVLWSLVSLSKKDTSGLVKGKHEVMHPVIDDMSSPIVFQ
jgi:hypothetical protein